MSIDLEKYLDVVWVAGGRAFPNLDCYGVINEVRRDLGLEEWPEYDGVTKDGGGLAEYAAQEAAARPGSDLVEGAVAFCYQGSVVDHVAVLVEVDGRMCALECSQAHNVTVMPLQRFERRYLRVEYFG